MVVRSLCDSLIRASLLASIALATCSGSACSGDDDDGAPAVTPVDGGGKGKPPSARDAATGSARDGATSEDSGLQDADGAVGTFDCKLGLASKISTIADPLVRFPLPTFAWTGDGAVGVWPGAAGIGYRVVELDRHGAITVPFRTLWSEEPAMADPSIAVRAGVLAIADRRTVGVNSRNTCRLALVELNGGASRFAPTRVSDVPDDETGMNEAGDCQVAETANGFLLVWQQRVAVGPQRWTLFGQRFDDTAKAQGARLTLGSSSATQPSAPLVRSNGSRVLVVEQQAGAGIATLRYIEDDELESVEVQLASAYMLLDYGHGDFLLRTLEELHFLDGHGQARREPAKVGLREKFAPFGMGFVSISHEELVIARAYDATLRASSVPVSLSNNRAAIADSLVYAPDGEVTAGIVIDFGALLYVPFACEQ